MPEISRFYGIVVAMFTNDHPPPHFHARYAEHTAKYSLDGARIEGELPPRADRLVREWAGLHQHELTECWQRSMGNQSPGKIDPLS